MWLFLHISPYMAIYVYFTTQFLYTVYVYVLTICSRIQLVLRLCACDTNPQIQADRESAEYYRYIANKATQRDTCKIVVLLLWVSTVIFSITRGAVICC